MAQNLLLIKADITGFSSEQLDSLQTCSTEESSNSEDSLVSLGIDI